jgi:hypothetical protein
MHVCLIDLIRDSIFEFFERTGCEEFHCKVLLGNAGSRPAKLHLNRTELQFKNDTKTEARAHQSLENAKGDHIGALWQSIFAQMTLHR